MERCEKRAYQLLKTRKKEISWNIKKKCVTDFLMTVRSSNLKDYTFHYVVIAWKTSVYINFYKNKEKKFFFSSKRVFKHKEVISNLHVCSNVLGKMGSSYTFHTSTRILNSTHTNEFNIFSHNICRDVQHSISRSR